jgi:hypothetical protein
MRPVGTGLAQAAASVFTILFDKVCIGGALYVVYSIYYIVLVLKRRTCTWMQRLIINTSKGAAHHTPPLRWHRKDSALIHNAVAKHQIQLVGRQHMQSCVRVAELSKSVSHL